MYNVGGATTIFPSQAMRLQSLEHHPHQYGWTSAWIGVWRSSWSKQSIPVEILGRHGFLRAMLNLFPLPWLRLKSAALINRCK